MLLLRNETVNKRSRVCFTTDNKKVLFTGRAKRLSFNPKITTVMSKKKHILDYIG